MPAAARRSPLFFAAVNPFLPTPLPPALGFADRVFFGLSFGNFGNFSGCRLQGRGEGRRGGRGRGRSTDTDPLARSPARRIDQITTPPETFQWPTRPPQTEKKRHGNRKTRRYCTGLRLAWRYPARESGWRGIHTDTMRASVRACFRAAMTFSSFQTFTGSITMRADERGLARAERREDSDPDSTRSDPPRPRPRISLSKSPASSRSSFQLS